MKTKNCEITFDMIKYIDILTISYRKSDTSQNSGGGDIKTVIEISSKQ